MGQPHELVSRSFGQRIFISSLIKPRQSDRAHIEEFRKNFCMYRNILHGNFYLQKSQNGRQ